MMEWFKLLFSTSIASTVLLSIIFFCSKNWFVVKIAKSIQHRYDKDLEKHKDNLRKKTDIELVRLHGEIDVEVEKIKLKSRFYSESQFRIYNELWLTLYELKKAMYQLWTSVDKEKMSSFRQKLQEASDAIEKNSLLIESEHYDKFQNILSDLDLFQDGTKTLEELQKNQSKDLINPKDIAEWININRQTKNKLLECITEMRKSLRSQIC